jgi:hypothetical protein
MEAIQHIIDLAKASSVESIEAETRAAHGAVENLRLDRLHMMERQLIERLRLNQGIVSGESNTVGPVDEGRIPIVPRQRRPIRDDPQA